MKKSDDSDVLLSYLTSNCERIVEFPFGNPVITDDTESKRIEAYFEQRNVSMKRIKCKDFCTYKAFKDNHPEESMVWNNSLQYINHFLGILFYTYT